VTAPPVHADFAQLAEPHRRELLAHCYRMLGSLDDAEDAVQEAFLRAWRGYGGFAGRSSLRTWLYRIATNVCLDAAERHRVLPSGLGGPALGAGVEPGVDPDVDWLQPIPDALVTPESEDPAALVAARESVRLALVTGLQVLPARQRAVLMLREVLGFHATEVAEMLGTSVAAVKSTLQRARATLASALPAQAPVDEPSDAESRALLADYIAGFERADITLLERALRKDARLEMVGSRTWFAGVETCLAYMGRFLGRPGDWRMAPTSANGQPAAVTHFKGAPFGVAVLTLSPAGITRIVVWGDPALPARFGAD
jgi:RNA polymerase sigma-70 factor (ECF subfamily)